MGDEFFDSGSAWWCIHAQTGHVYRIDLAREQPFDFVNASVAQFASAAFATLSWSNRLKRSVTQWATKLDELTRQIAAIDPASLKPTGSFWPAYLDHLRDDQPHLGVFKKGTVSDGQQALRVETW